MIQYRLNGGPCTFKEKIARKDNGSEIVEILNIIKKKSYLEPSDKSQLNLVTHN